MRKSFKIQHNNNLTVVVKSTESTQDVEWQPQLIKNYRNTYLLHTITINNDTNYILIVNYEGEICITNPLWDFTKYIDKISLPFNLNGGDIIGNIYYNNNLKQIIIIVNNKLFILNNKNKIIFTRSLILNNNYILFGDLFIINNNRLIKFNPTTSPSWSINLKSKYNQAFTTSNLIILIGNGEIKGLDIKNGQIVWTNNLDPLLGECVNAVVYNSVLYLLSNNGILIICNINETKLEIFNKIKVPINGKLSFIPDKNNFVIYNNNVISLISDGYEIIKTYKLSEVISIYINPIITTNYINVLINKKDSAQYLQFTI